MVCLMVLGILRFYRSPVSWLVQVRSVFAELLWSLSQEVSVGCHSGVPSEDRQPFQVLVLNSSTSSAQTVSVAQANGEES